MQELREELGRRKRIRAAARGDEPARAGWQPTVLGAGLSCAALVLIAALSL